MQTDPDRNGAEVRFCTLVGLANFVLLVVLLVLATSGA